MEASDVEGEDEILPPSKVEFLSLNVCLCLLFCVNAK